ncbi:Retrotransposon gag protein [Corchorus olitorius]|uniref:Retrotransposon gag protein n=1 Tax=Corchorus olitorius TaxID=93759 RepID=A0A1R3KUK0_9ROSI|nr:Retrotransposon gag protein [Corchorus olitorius]
MEQQRSLRELNFNCELPPLCIDYPAMDMSYKLNSGVIRMLPTFQGESHENPHEHLQNLFIWCAATTGMPEEQARLRTFPLTFEGKARSWFLTLPSKSITSWKEMETVFLNKYFQRPSELTYGGESQPANNNLKRSGTNTERDTTKICASCPYHNLSEAMLIQNFYDGLLYEDRMHIDAASGGSLTLKTPEEARKLLNTMIGNIHQFNMMDEISTTRSSEKDLLPR